MKLSKFNNPFLQITIFGLFWYIAKSKYRYAYQMAISLIFFRIIVFTLIFLFQNHESYQVLFLMSKRELLFLLCIASVFKINMLIAELTCWFIFNAIFAFIFTDKRFKYQLPAEKQRYDVFSTVMSLVALGIIEAVLYVLCIDMSLYINEPNTEYLINYIYFETNFLIIVILLFLGWLVFKDLKMTRKSNIK